MTAPDPQYPVPPPRPPAGPAYPPPPGPPEPMSGPPGMFSGPPAPYSVSPAPPAKPPRSRGAVFATGVAVLALLVAAVSLVVAWRAIDQADDARQFALAGGGVAVAPATGAPTPPPTTAAPPTTAPAATEPATVTDPTSTGEPPPLDARTVYTPKYERQVLTLRVAGCNDSMYIDLDEPRANVGSNDNDLTYYNRCAGEASVLRLGDGVEASDTGSPQMTPHDCAERIRTAPLGSEASVPVRKGVVLCVTTSLATARSKGDSQRMVRLEITGVADDRTVTLQSTAWDIPR